MNITKNRLQSLDLLRGIALILVVFLHASIYNYANINKIDFNNPPFIVIIISILTLWGGIFIFYSGIVNTLMIAKRIENNFCFSPFKYLLFAGGIYIIVHYILNIFLGRWNNDFINNKPDMTVVASSMRNMRLTFPKITKFFEGSSISTIGLNLIIISILLFFLLKNKGITKEKRNYWILGTLGFLIMIFSFLRVNLYHLLAESIHSQNYLVATILSFTIANPYPLLPYLAYGLFASILGLMIYNNRKDLIKKIIIPFSLFFLLFGVTGSSNFEKTISKADYFWYFKTHLELGIFMFFTALLTLTFKNKVFHKLSIIKWFSRISLTIYLLEVSVSETLGLIMRSIIPKWNQSINACLAFGVLNVLVWGVILFFWRKINFKFSLEYLWVKYFKRIGKYSTKMDQLLSDK